MIVPPLGEREQSGRRAQVAAAVCAAGVCRRAPTLDV